MRALKFLGLLALLYIPGILVGLSFCKFRLNGWCADWQPFEAVFTGFVFGPLVFVLACAVRKMRRKQGFIIPFVLTAFTLSVLGGTFFFFEIRRSSLLTAAHAGNAPEVRRWLGWGADPNATGPFQGASALSEAVASGSVAAVEALLDGGAQVDPVDPCNIYSPLLAAYRNRRLAIIQVLKSRGAKPLCPGSKNQLMKELGYNPEDF